MYSIKLHFISLLILGGIASVAHADDYQEIKGSGKPDAVLCGFNVNKTTMKEIFAKLGETNEKKPDADEPRQVTFSWTRGSLQINISAYVVYKFPNDRPVSIEATGSDPENFCKTGRGVALGDPVAHALKAYAAGKNKGKIAADGDTTLVFKWGEEDTDVSFSIAKDKSITRISVTGEE